MILRTLALVLLVGLAAGCAAPQESAPQPRDPGDPPAPGAAPPPAREPVRFLAWGDSGMGNDAQRAMADAAARVCARDGCDLVLQLGDNVYPDGVNGTDDPQWQEKFERPFANLTMPFYAVLGNHDVRGRGGAQAQLAYASERWRMPARNYSVEEGPAIFYGLDLTGAGERDATLPSDWRAMDALNETLDATDARWRIVFSHFPYASPGSHGDAGRYDGEPGRGAALRALVQEAVCPRADLYLSGHDHLLAWLDAPAPCKTAMVVSGAAATPRNLTRTNATPFAQGDVVGFFWFEASETRLLGRAYDAEGALLFEREIR